MRMDTLRCLDDAELSLLLYVVNCIDPMTCPKMDIGVPELPWLNQERLINKLAAQESKLTTEGKETLRSLIAKLTRYPQHEAEIFQQQENERTKAGKSS